MRSADTRVSALGSTRTLPVGGMQKRLTSLALCCIRSEMVPAARPSTSRPVASGNWKAPLCCCSQLGKSVVEQGMPHAPPWSHRHASPGSSKAPPPDLRQLGQKTLDFPLPAPVENAVEVSMPVVRSSWMGSGGGNNGVPPAVQSWLVG